MFTYALFESCVLTLGGYRFVYGRRRSHFFLFGHDACHWWPRRNKTWLANERTNTLDVLFLDSETFWWICFTLSTFIQCTEKLNILLFCFIINRQIFVSTWSIRMGSAWLPLLAPCHFSICSGKIQNMNSIRRISLTQFYCYSICAYVENGRKEVNSPKTSASTARLLSSPAPTRALAKRRHWIWRNAVAKSTWHAVT